MPPAFGFGRWCLDWWYAAKPAGIVAVAWEVECAPAFSPCYGYPRSSTSYHGDTIDRQYLPNIPTTGEAFPRPDRIPSIQAMPVNVHAVATPLDKVGGEGEGDEIGGGDG